MTRREYRLSRPIYEGLPWFYVGCGLLALVASYFQESRPISLILGVLGLACVLGGVVVLLRRRDFRELSAHYNNSDSSDLSPRD
jgi:hypothetical protein